MQLVLNVKLEELEDKINRKIIVDDTISLESFCELIIISMNGNKPLMYKLYCDNMCYLPFDDDLDILILKDLNLNKKSDIYINYDDNYTIIIELEEIKNSYTKDFEVISFTGNGILDDVSIYSLINIIPCTNQKYLNKKEINYLVQHVSIDDINYKIDSYYKQKLEAPKPKSYIINIALEGFNTEIKRKIIINNNITIGDLCRKVVLTMNRDLSHCYSLKIRNTNLNEEYSEIKFYNLYLSCVKLYD